MTPCLDEDDEVCRCSQCGIKENFDLLDAECADGEPTGRLLCVRCAPSWLPPGDEEEILDLSIAPELKPFYVKWLNRNVVSFPSRTP